jgi:uncharacterized protein YbjT (DUF2867 family)
MQTRNALIAGASGLVGSQLMELLLADPAYSKVMILVRKTIPVNHAKLIQLQVSYEQLDLLSIPIPVQDVFCALGTTIRKAGSQAAFRVVDYDYVLNLGKFGEKNLVSKYLVVSAMGADASSGIFYNRVKGEMENAIRNLNIPSVIVFRPSLLMGNRKDFRLGERIAQFVMSGLGFLFVNGLKKYKPIHATLVAKSMITVAGKAVPGYRVVDSGEMISGKL